ncbi:MAG: transglutaminase domain-containing protein [Methanomicrobium sp.]|nr:transglutaminase domain-containing protein [Methanomicrobium sp.]
MILRLYSTTPEDYHKCDDIIDYDSVAVRTLADTLCKEAGATPENTTPFIKSAYEFVRDHISHSADINADAVTVSASEVLKARHGICFAKSHLLAAILRSKSVPAGFCYQKIVMDDDTAPVLIYHGLNAVYLRDYDKWVRLDARGNKPGINAQFSIDGEQLAYPIRSEKGEMDGIIVYPNPDTLVVNTMRQYRSRTQLWDHLPTELGYDRDKY